MSNFEKKLENEIRLHASKQGHRLARCNSGQAWTGKILQNSNSGLKNGTREIRIQNPRVFHGHAEGTPDLAGFARVTVTEEMVGQVIPVFCSVELKTPAGRLRPAQAKCLEGLKKIGAICGVARKVTDFDEILRQWKTRFTQKDEG